MALLVHRHRPLSTQVAQEQLLPFDPVPHPKVAAAWNAAYEGAVLAKGTLGTPSAGPGSSGSDSGARMTFARAPVRGLAGSIPSQTRARRNMCVRTSVRAATGCRSRTASSVGGGLPCLQPAHVRLGLLGRERIVPRPIERGSSRLDVVGVRDEHRLHPRRGAVLPACDPEPVGITVLAFTMDPRARWSCGLARRALGRRPSARPRDRRRDARASAPSRDRRRVPRRRTRGGRGPPALGAPLRTARLSTPSAPPPGEVLLAADPMRGRRLACNLSVQAP